MTRHSGPLVLGGGALVGWYVWERAERADVTAAIVLGLALGTPLAVSVAALHEGTARAHFIGAWRFAAALLGLATFAVLAIGPLEDSPVPGSIVFAAIPVVVISLLAAVCGDGRQRVEIGGALLAAAAAIALVAFTPEAGRECSCSGARRTLRRRRRSRTRSSRSGCLSSTRRRSPTAARSAARRRLRASASARCCGCRG